jgi:hypothetical protein
MTLISIRSRPPSPYPAVTLLHTYPTYCQQLDSVRAYSLPTYAAVNVEVRGDLHPGSGSPGAKSFLTSFWTNRTMGSCEPEPGCESPYGVIVRLHFPVQLLSMGDERTRVFEGLVV